VKRLTAEHGIVCRLADERFGYFGWPSVARTEDGALIVASSGLRTQHICPWGKTVLNVSLDEGRTWSWPRVISDSPIDDRDAGIISLGSQRLLVSWFTSDTRQYADENHAKSYDVEGWKLAISTWTDEMVARWLGSWVIMSEDGGETWGRPVRVAVTSPHGPIRLASGDLLYLGKDFTNPRHSGHITSARSSDAGRTWTVTGVVPEYPGTGPGNYHEPHVVELSSGKLIGMVRVQGLRQEHLDQGLIEFSLFQTESTDGGVTWSPASPIGVYGSPPHLIRHSSGALVCVYGYRRPGFGQRAMLSDDDGATWDSDWIIRDDGPDGDLGYPASVEMDDGSIFTVYYQKVPGDTKCSLLWSRWRLS